MIILWGCLQSWNLQIPWLTAITSHHLPHWNARFQESALLIQTQSSIVTWWNPSVVLLNPKFGWWNHLQIPRNSTCQYLIHLDRQPCRHWGCHAEIPPQKRGCCSPKVSLLSNSADLCFCVEKSRRVTTASWHLHWTFATPPRLGLKKATKWNVYGNQSEVNSYILYIVYIYIYHIHNIYIYCIYIYYYYIYIYHPSCFLGSYD